MLCPGLACLVTVVSGLVLTGGSSAEEAAETNSVSVPLSIAVRHRMHLAERNNHFQEYVNENGWKQKKSKKSHRLIRDLKRVILKLKNVIGKYDQKNDDLSVFYLGVTNCGVSNCGKFHEGLPEKLEPKDFNCNKFKRRRELKKWTLEILSKAYNGGRIYEEQFQKLIYFENLDRFQKQDKSKGSRLTILTELQNEIRALSVEILDIKGVEGKKRLNSSDDTSQIPGSHTDLKIKEWYTLQQSKDYLRQFCRTLEAVPKCWKRERKWDSKKKKGFLKNESKREGKSEGLPARAVAAAEQLVKQTDKKKTQKTRRKKDNKNTKKNYDKKECTTHKKM